MPEWTKLNSKDVYVIVAEDISDSLHRYFAPVIGLIGGVGKSISIADTEKKNPEQQKDSLRGLP